MRVPVTISTPEFEMISLYYDTVSYTFYHQDGSSVGDELPTDIWKMAAEIVMRVLGDIEQTEEDVVVTVPPNILEAIQRQND